MTNKKSVPNGLSIVRKDEYLAKFQRKEKYEPSWKRTKAQRVEKAQRAFEFIVDTRKFEIELYWKRATYFWAFIAVTFAGYAALINANTIKPFQIHVVSCVGLLLSVAWYFSNLGSKSWQQNWETHLDNFEDKFMGPLYKTISMSHAHSVSKINEFVSMAFIAVWILLLVDNVISNYHYVPEIKSIHSTVLFFLCLAIPLIFTICAIVDKCRSYSKVKKFEMFERKTSFNEPS